MRSMLKYQSLRQFSSQKLSQIIQTTAENLKQQQKHNVAKYEELFFKLYTSQLARQKKLNLNVKKLDAICMLGQFPCRSIVEHFHATAKSYSEQYTVQTFVRLSRAYKISQADNSSTADFSINRLFFSPAFENLIEQYKYGLRKEHAMSWENAFLVAECLIDIGYADYEVFSILLGMVESKLNKQPRNSTEIRTFQIEKKDYYISRLQNSQPALTNDPEFQSVLKLLSARVRQHELHTKKTATLQDLQHELSINPDSQTIYRSILNSISMIENYNQNLTQLIQAIITVRKQYRKMTQITQNKQILRNPELNLELLELQEMLLVKKLITIHDIKTPSKIDQQDFQLKRVEEILISMIDPADGSFSSSEITEFITTVTDSEHKEATRLTKLKEISEYSRAMATLTRFAEVSRRVYNAPDARSLISMKWQKTLLLWNKGGDDSVEWKENLHAQKIFRRTFGDVYQMMKRCYSLFMFTLIEAPLKYKLEFFESLTRLGYQSELINLLENEELGKQKVQTYSNQQFVSLIKVLNEIGDKIPADNLKRGALKQLKKLTEESQLEESKSMFTMEFTTNAINFICQNFNVQSAELGSAVANKDDTQILYDTLINKLVEQARYFDQSINFLTNDHLYEAYRVLAFERPGEFKLGKAWYGRFGINVSDPKDLKDFLYRKNPFHSILQQLCAQYATSPLNQEHPFLQTGFNQKGDLTAVLLCSSDQSSMDGQHVTGHTNAYMHRVKREYNISITPLSVNSLLDIDYEKLPQNQEFAFKSKEVIAQALKQLFKKDELHLVQFSELLANITLVLQKHYKRSHMYAVVKLLNTLNECIKLYNNEKEVLSFPLFKFRRYRLWVQLDTLKEDYHLIDKSVKDELEKMWKKQSSSSLSQFLQKQSTILGCIQSIQQLILSSVNSQQPTPLAKTLFEGKRFSIETFIESEMDKQNLGVEFVNPTTYVDKTFCPYSDWAECLGEAYPMGAVKLNDASNLVKVLAKKFLPNAKEELTLLPFVKASELKHKPQFTLDSLPPLKPEEDTEPKTTSAKPTEQQLEQIRSLLSFIHELKMQKSQQELAEYILSFDFITNTHLKPSEKSNAGPLPRRHSPYINYLESQNHKLYLESPHLDYLLNKLQQREEISQIFNARKQRRAQVKMQFQLAEITRKEFIAKCEQIDDQIIAKLKTLDQNVLDNVEEYKFLHNGLKMIKIQKDEKQLERVFNRARYYFINLDKDFIHTKGNTEKWIKIKRFKAQKTLALYKVLYKLGKGDVQLTENDRELLAKEAAAINYRLENKKDPADAFNDKFTALTIGDLSKQDKQRLRLRGVDLSQYHSLPLTDLILQLVNLLDPKVHQSFERSITKKYYTATHGLPEQLFISGLNKQFTKLAYEQQRQIINEQSKLNSYDIGLINEMVQTFKTQSKTGKERFAQLYDSFYEDIQLLNDSEARVELITEYLAQKEIEYEEEYNPRLISETKENQVMKLWSVLFKETYHNSDSQLIQNTVNKLCQRIPLMSDTPPPFFGLLVIRILQHPQTDVLTKQNLISNLAQHKTSLVIDSEDIRLLGEACSKQEKETRPTSDKLMEQMGLISNKNFMESLSKKINMIV